MTRLALILTAVSLLGSSACAGAKLVSAPAALKAVAPGSQNPAWIDKLILQFQTDPVSNPPRSIWKYDYKDAVVYFIPAPCCDQFSELYSAGGTLLCAPNGGLAGRGDGRCTDFFALRKNEVLIWRDSRTKEKPKPEAAK